MNRTLGYCHQEYHNSLLHMVMKEIIFAKTKKYIYRYELSVSRNYILLNTLTLFLFFIPIFRIINHQFRWNYLSFQTQTNNAIIKSISNSLLDLRSKEKRPLKAPKKFMGFVRKLWESRVYWSNVKLGYRASDFTIKRSAVWKILEAMNVRTCWW